MLYIIHQLTILLLLLSSACGGPPRGQSSSEVEDVAFENEKNQNLKCAGKVVENNVGPPTFKKVQKTNGMLQVSTQIKWKADEGIKKKYKATFQALENIAKAVGTEKEGATIVSIEIVSPATFRKFEVNVPVDFENKHELYLLQVKPDQINIYALDEAGIVNGISTLEFLCSKFKGKIEQGNILDWPDLETRAAQLVLRAITPEVATGAIDRMRRTHYNTVLLSISNNVQFESIGKLANNCAWPIEDFLKVVEYARESGMEVIPELRFLSHQHKDFLVTGAYPDLMYNEKTYNPNNEKVYKIVFAYIDEVIALINPQAIHIGHDEVFGISGRDAGAKDALPAELFKYDVLKLHNYLKKKNVRTWMWGDMLITPSEFPEMHPGSINGNKEYARLRKEIPKDIVICDWHYRDDAKTSGTKKFPSLKTFADEGFDVLGATFRDPRVTRQFAGYAADLESPRVKGMIATTWSFLRRGAQNNRQSDDWKAFDAVLQYSAEAFWNADKM